MLFYRTFYVYDKTVPGKWRAYNFSEESTRGWIAADASASLSLDSSTLDQESWVLVYGCARQNDAWRCGCYSEFDTQCQKWSIQNFTKPPETCVDGSVRACYDGPAGTAGVGACKNGSQSCTANTWGACAGQVVPLAEACTNTIDDDCDGLVDCGDSDCVAVPACASCADVDGDGYTDVACGGSDCDETNAAVNPGATEACTNTIDDDCDGLVDCADPDCVAVPACASSPTGMNVTSCTLVFSDNNIEQAVPLYGRHDPYFNFAHDPDLGIIHTFRAFTYRPATNDLLFVDDYGLTSLVLDAAGTSVVAQKSIAHLCSESGPVPMITDQGTGGSCPEPFPGFTAYINPHGTDPGMMSIFPSGRVAVGDIGSEAFLHVFGGAGAALHQELTFGNGQLSTPPPNPRPIDDVTATVLGVAVLNSSIIPGKYGHYWGYFEDAAGQHRYGYLFAGDTPWDHPRRPYLVDLTDPYHPVLLGLLSHYPVLEEYLTTDLNSHVRPFRMVSLGGARNFLSDLVAPVSDLDRFITKQGHVRVYNLSDPLQGVLVDDIPLPGWDETGTAFRHSFGRVFYYSDVHDVAVLDDKVYVYVPGYSCKLLRHTIGQPGWEQFDFGVTDCLRIIDNENLAAYSLSLADDGSAVVLTDKYARTFRLYDITGAQPNLLLQEDLPFGYRDASISTPSGNSWATYYPAPFLRARGDGTYLLYLAEPLNSELHWRDKHSAVMAVTLAPGSRDSACLCQPDCTGKTCGASDGCGGYCQYVLDINGIGVVNWRDSLCDYPQSCQVTTLGQSPVCAPKPI